jgi:hypothetical protein
MTAKRKILVLSSGLLASGFFQVSFWLVGYAPGMVGLIGFVSTLLSAALGFVAYREAIELDEVLLKLERTTTLAGEKAHGASIAAEAASRAAKAAERGRRLSPDQKAVIAAKLNAVDLGHTRANVAYVPAATEARDFAQSITSFLGKLGVRCSGPHAINPTGYPQPRQSINGTLFVVSSNPAEVAEMIVDAFVLTIPGIRRTGEGSHGHVNTNDQIKIIVGHRT